MPEVKRFLEKGRRMNKKNFSSRKHISLVIFGLSAMTMLSVFLVVAADNQSSSTFSMRVDAGRLEKHIKKLAEFGMNDHGGIDRVAFSDADIQAREYLKDLMRAAGLSVSVDQAGNIIGRREGSSSSLPSIMFGSHADSVPDGGKYDGAVGVLAAIECAQTLQENDVLPRHPIEVIVFSDEEGGLVGSRALTGSLTPEALDVISHSGLTVREGIKTIGGDPDHIDKAAREKGAIKAFIEVHIEQGSILEDRDIDIGVVEGIVGINWWDVTIQGFSNHAGTTPMDRRQDALLAAAHLILAVNKIVTDEPGRQVGTVGRIKAEPGAPNVIPGRVVMSLELRDLSAEKIELLFQNIKKSAKEISSATNTKITFSSIDATAVPAPTDPDIRRYITSACEGLGVTSLLMPSGAGHDAQDMSRIAPTGMIFVPSVGGVSHSPKEFSCKDDIVNGANVLLHTILKIDRQ
jgi:N-carbamoyl-L-amino-acid hydrolase